MRYLLLVLCFIFSGLSANGRTVPTAHPDSLAQPFVCDSATVSFSLPQRVDLHPYCPSVKNQGELNSCVGWALGYGALTIQRAIQHGCTDTKVITHNASSAMFLYNQLPKDAQGRGARLVDAAAFLETRGDCLARHFDTDITDEKKRPDSLLAVAAQSFAIAGYDELFSPQDPDSVKVMRVKATLVQQRPVTIGMAIRRNFMLLRNAKYWHPDLGDTTPAGGHALVVIGYDDQRQAFQLMNSWGKEWGKDGFIWIKYSTFAKFAKYGLVLHLTETELVCYNPKSLLVNSF